MKRILFISVFACFQLLSFGQVSISQEVEELYQTGCNYRDGENGVTKDLKKAVEYFTKAAEQGHASAQADLGDCYYNGNGVYEDNDKAVEWYRKAAEQGNASGQYGLGGCYLYGYGVTKNYAKALELYRKAANQGNAKAQNSIGTCYYHGEGVKKNYVQAIEWFRKAADQGNACALYNLGLCYKNGRGVAKNMQKAIEWYEKARDAGYEDASKEIEEILLERKVAPFKKKYGFDPSVNNVRSIIKVGRNVLAVIYARNEWQSEYGNKANQISVKLVKDQGASKCYEIYSSWGAFYEGYFWTRNNVITSITWK